MNNPQKRDSIVVVGMNDFESEYLWWIGYYDYEPGCSGLTLDDVDTNSEFGNCFCKTQCIETHPPDDVNAAIQRAHEIAKAEDLPLFRVTRYRDSEGTSCEVFEEVT